MLEGQQRLAFERYVDARIEFLESRVDEMNRPNAGPPAEVIGAAPIQPEDSGVRVWLRIISSRPVLQTLAVFLLCTTAFCLIIEQRRVRNLEMGRDELRAAVVRTAQEIELLRQRVDTGTAPPAQHIQQLPPTPAPEKPLTTPKRDGRRLVTGSGPARQHAAHQASANRTTPESQSAGRRRTNEFSLSPSREFKRVGSLSVLLKAIDKQRRYASLTIATGTAEVDVQHLRLNQPVWVNASNYDQPLGLVIDRITATRVEGHLVEADNSRADLRTSRYRNYGTP